MAPTPSDKGASRSLPPDLRVDGGRRQRDGSYELRLLLTNPNKDRALHYITNPRRIVVDEATGKFTLHLSDVGREVIPGAVNVLPKFATVDPEGTAVLALVIPESIVRMSATPTSSGEIVLEEFGVSPGADIEVAVGWSDTPYYEDPREKSKNVVSTAAWELGRVETVYHVGRSNK